MVDCWISSMAWLVFCSLLSKWSSKRTAIWSRPALLLGSRNKGSSSSPKRLNPPSGDVMLPLAGSA